MLNRLGATAGSEARAHGMIRPSMLHRSVCCNASFPSRDTGPTINLQQYDDCELLWLQYLRELSIGKSAALWALQDVQRGALPCDAEVLRLRASELTALSRLQQVPGLDALRVLNTSRHALHFDSGYVQQVLRQLQKLLPGSRPTQLLLDLLADMDLPPEILALQHQQANAVFKECLGAHVTPKVMHHLLQHWRQQQQAQDLHRQAAPQGPHTAGSSAGPQPNVQQQMWPVGDTSKQGAMLQQPGAATGQAAGTATSTAVARRSLNQQLLELSDVLGPELAHAAVANTPVLLDADPSIVLAHVQWMQQQLQVSPVAALLLAQSAGEVLLLPRATLEARYNNLCYLLQHLLGWRLQQVHTLLCNAPQLLACESARLATNWQFVQHLSRRRSLWLEEMAAGSQALVIAVLCAEQHQLQQLRYVAEAREMQGQGLVSVLRTQHVRFVLACPGFRVWRGLVPGDKRRWSLVESGCIVAHSTLAPAKPTGKVMAVDKQGHPTLIQLKKLSPYDRLVIV